jgi:hypothetical protein
MSTIRTRRKLITHEMCINLPDQRLGCDIGRCTMLDALFCRGHMAVASLLDHRSTAIEEES